MILTTLTEHGPFCRLNPLNAKLNPIFHLLALLGACNIFHFSGLRVNIYSIGQKSLPFMHYEVPLPYPQSPTTGCYPRLDESILHFLIIYFNIH
jgi:hypothetical protein